MAVFAKTILRIKNVLSTWVDNPVQHVPHSRVPTFYTVEAVWKYIQENVPFNTSNTFTYIHPLRMKFFAEISRIAKSKGSMTCWPQALLPGESSVTLFATFLCSTIPHHKSELVTLVLENGELRQVCVVSDHENRLYSISLYGLKRHYSETELLEHFMALYKNGITRIDTPIPFGLEL